MMTDRKTANHSGLCQGRDQPYCLDQGAEIGLAVSKSQGEIPTPLPYLDLNSKPRLVVPGAP